MLDCMVGREPADPEPRNAIRHVPAWTLLGTILFDGSV